MVTIRIKYVNDREDEDVKMRLERKVAVRIMTWYWVHLKFSVLQPKTETGLVIKVIV